MDEKLFKKVKATGVSSLIMGIIVLVVGIASGVLMIINGGRLLAHKSDKLF